PLVERPSHERGSSQVIEHESQGREAPGDRRHEFRMRWHVQREITPGEFVEAGRQRVTLESVADTAEFRVLLKLIQLVPKIRSAKIDRNHDGPDKFKLGRDWKGA